MEHVHKQHLSLTHYHKVLIKLEHLADVGALVPAGQVLDHERPLSVVWHVVEVDSRVLRVDVGSRRQDVPVPLAHPRDLME